MAAWRDFVSGAVFQALCAVFNLSPESEEANARFIEAYQEDATNTQPPRKTNLVYYALSIQQDTEYDYVQTGQIMDGQTPKTYVQKTIPVDVLLTFYGKNADDDAETFWSQIQVDSGKGSARSILRSKKIVPRGTPSRPVSLYEVEGTYQRRRCDVHWSLAYLATDTAAFEPITSAPEVGMITNVDR